MTFVKKLIKYFANLATPIETTTNIAKWQFKNKLLRLSGLKIANNVAISSGFLCINGNEDNICINEHVAIGHNVKLYNFNKINIGSFTTIAADVSITNGGHDLATLEPMSGEVKIGNGCWIGHAARIVRPVTIGDNAIIAAGAIVTKDVPPASIVAGVPARVIKTRELPDKVWFLGNIYFDPVTFTKIN